MSALFQSASVGMNYKEILLYGVYSDLRTEVARRFLGFLWWIIDPILYMGAFYIVFALALRQGGPYARARPASPPRWRAQP